ncbi:MAG: PKD domain-containing protein [Phycisphaerae bacterium]|nr:PKD domain-containing protein [Phycisphaerae bacterium]
MKNTHHSGSSVAGRGHGIVLWVMAAALALAIVPRVAPALEPGDTEPNEVVDLRDLLAIRNVLGQTGPPGFVGADIDVNGVVDNDDLLIWRQHYPYVGAVDGPYLAIFTPVHGSLIGDRRPTIVIDYSPTGLNVDPDTLTVVVDGKDCSADAIKSFRVAVVPVEDALEDGPHYVEVSIQDVQGTLATVRSDFEVTAIALRPKAIPQTGPAPLEVAFEPGVIWADSAPAWYRWDWEDDGTYNIIDPRPDRRTYTFYEEGLHTIRFQVQQSDGTLTETTLQVAVTETVASASPANGTRPLTVFLHGIAADLNDPIVLYEWDFDNDGVWDYSSATSPNTAHVYVFPGVYEPQFRATHQSSAVVEYPIVGDEVHVQDFGAPTAVAAAAQGANALTVNFSGNGSDDGTIELYEWDFENDGIWDYSSATSGDVSHTYPAAGTRVAALRVTDNDSNTVIDRVRFKTFAPASLEVLDDTVVPLEGEAVTIRTTMTIESTVWLYIRTADGRIIHTLVDHEVRPAGTYDDTWDGRDFRYEPCHPEGYYAVLEYTYPGRTDTLDLAETTGGIHYFATRVPPLVTQFDPFVDNPLPMHFELGSASRASLYILPGGTNRINTMFDNLALGAGDYTYYWSGLTSDGEFAPSASYLWSVNAWTLGDNAIVVRGQPTISNIEVTPNYFSPTDRPLGSAVADIAFDLDEPASVFVKIVCIDNQNTLRTFQLADAPAGTNNVIWNGKTIDDVYVSPGYYRILMVAVDGYGNLSIERDALIEIRY